MNTLEGHKLTMRELYEAMGKVHPDHPAWNEPIDIMLSGGTSLIENRTHSLTAYKFGVEDVTDDCDGSCGNPTCVYALDAATNGGEGAGYDGGAGDVPPGYTDEGLHFAATLWANDGA